MAAQCPYSLISPEMGPAELNVCLQYNELNAPWLATVYIIIGIHMWCSTSIMWSLPPQLKEAWAAPAIACGT